MKLPRLFLVICSLAIILGCSHEKRLNKLLEELSFGSDKEKTISALGKLRDSQAVEPLIKLLTQVGEMPSNQRVAALALGNIGDNRAIEPLIKALKNEDYSVRYAAVTGLILMYNDTVYAALNRELEMGNVEAAEIFYRLSEKRAVSALIRELNSGDFYLRQMAILALGAIKDSTAIEPLKDSFLEHPNAYKFGDDHSLGSIWLIGTYHAKKIITEMLDKEDVNCRAAAVYSLSLEASPEDPDLIKLLIRALNDDHVEVRKPAARGLVEAGSNPQAHESLMNACYRKDLAIVAECYEFYLDNLNTRIEPILSDALENGDKDMALALLNSGNEKLRQAAESWANRNNYKVEKSVSLPGPPFYKKSNGF
jgi:HEAT repeat protein